MEWLFSWIKENQVLSGAGVAVLSGLGWILKKATEKSPAGNSGATVGLGPSISIVNNNSSAHSLNGSSAPTTNPSEHLRQKAGRDLVRILFVDDDTKFKVVNILKNAGWRNVKITKDIRDFESPEVKEAQIFFVDIQGVGKAMGFQDEGLGLSLALKQKYPEKKVVIYSAQTDGDRFHRALNKADGSLSKNAEPYQFIALVEELMGG